MAQLNNRWDIVELRDYLRIARRRWRVIILIAAIACALATTYSELATKQYASSARVFVSTVPSSTDGQDGAAYQGSLFSQQRVASYADMVGGVGLAQRVVDTLHLDTTAASLAAKVKAVNEPNTVLLDITVTDPSALQAQRINTAVLQQLQEMVTEIETPPGGTKPQLKATVIDPPNLSTSPVSPKPTRNLLLALLVGLLLGFGVAVVREILDNTVQDFREIREVRDAPVLSTLAFDGDVSPHPLISDLPSHSPRAEAFRVLRTNVQFLDVDASSKALVFSSSVPGEGKSTTSVNTALALASGNNRVIIVDADLRRSSVARLLGLENTVGLTTVLVGKLELNEAIQHHEQSGLAVLTAGQIPPNPAELLQSKAMSRVIEDLRKDYDTIIIDAPPLLPVTDAALLASETDGAVLVVHYGRTTKDQLAGAAARLAAVDAPVLGLIMNMVPRKRGMSGGYGYGGYGYGYGYGYAPIDSADIKTTRRQRRAATKAAKAAAKA